MVRNSKAFPLTKYTARMTPLTTSTQHPKCPNQGTEPRPQQTKCQILIMRHQGTPNKVLIQRGEKAKTSKWRHFL